MLVAQLLAIAAAATGAATQNATIGTLFPLDTYIDQAGQEHLEKRNNYYTQEALQAWGNWLHGAFNVPNNGDGNVFIAASYVNHNVFCDHSQQKAWYQGAEYVLYHFYCGALFWSKWPGYIYMQGNRREAAGPSILYW